MSTYTVTLRFLIGFNDHNDTPIYSYVYEEHLAHNIRHAWILALGKDPDRIGTDIVQIRLKEGES